MVTTATGELPLVSIVLVTLFIIVAVPDASTS